MVCQREPHTVPIAPLLHIILLCRALKLLRDSRVLLSDFISSCRRGCWLTSEDGLPDGPSSQQPWLALSSQPWPEEGKLKELKQVQD